MTDGNTGSGQNDQKELNARYALFEAFSKEVLATWTIFQQCHEISREDPAKFTRITSHALLQLAATLAVDVNLTEENFVKIAHACHKVAYQRAPKFG